MNSNIKIVTYNQAVCDELGKYLNIDKIQYDHNEDPSLKTEINNFDFLLQIEKFDASLIKKWDRFNTIGAKKKIVTLSEFKGFNEYKTYDELVEMFYEKKTFYHKGNEVVIITPPPIDIFQFNKETNAEFVKRCLNFFNNQVYFKITPIINSEIKVVREFRHISLVNKNKNGEYETTKIENRIYEEKDPSFLPLLKKSIISLGEFLNKNGTTNFIISPPPNDIDFDIMMEEERQENEDNYDGWQELGDQEMRRWDKETGGSWRIENDLD